MLDNEMFRYQLDLIKLAYTENTLIIGDLNLDFAKRHDDNYAMLGNHSSMISKTSWVIFFILE